jgi:hypothetical protein
MSLRDRNERDLDALRSQELVDPDDAALHHLGAVARSLTDEDHDLQEPPPGVWARISATVAEQRTGTEDEAGADDAGADEPATAPVVRPARWWRPSPLLAAAAAVVVAVGIVGAIVVTGDGNGNDPVVVASVDLEPLTDVQGGTARLVDTDGQLALDMAADAAALPDPDGFYEVWLIDEDVEGMISLGPMRVDGTYEVPVNVDYRDYPIVDVSIEPDDGDPTHSGSSILRGTLSS